MPQLEIPQRSAADAAEFLKANQAACAARLGSAATRPPPKRRLTPSSGIIPRMMRDYLGNPITGERDSTLRGIDEFIEGYLAYETRAERILGVAAADPESCLANVYAGMLWMLLEAPEGAVTRRKILSGRRDVRRRSATRREQLNAAMLRAWVDDDLERSIRLCDQVSDEFPRDLAIVKTHQYFEFNRGNSPEMLRVALKVGSANSRCSLRAWHDGVRLRAMPSARRGGVRRRARRLPCGARSPGRSMPWRMYS